MFSAEQPDSTTLCEQDTGTRGCRDTGLLKVFSHFQGTILRLQLLITNMNPGISDRMLQRCEAAHNIKHFLFKMYNKAC